MKILYLEEDPMVAEFLDDFFREAYDHRITFFNRARECLYSFAQNPADVDLIVAEIIQPPHEFSDFLEMVYELKPNAAVVIYTASVEETDEELAKSFPIKFFLRKPIEPGILENYFWRAIE